MTIKHDDSNNKSSQKQSEGQTVKAECSDCRSVHTLGSRVYDGTVTRCPGCGSTSYTTDCTVETTSKDDVRATLSDVPNVGEQVLNNIEASVGSLTLVSTCSPEQLADIDHVGPTTAHRILDAL